MILKDGLRDFIGVTFHYISNSRRYVVTCFLPSSLGAFLAASCVNFEKLLSSIMRTGHKLVSATELAEFVYCSQAWHSKHIQGATVSPAARRLQIEANAWHTQ